MSRSEPSFRSGIGCARGLGSPQLGLYLQVLQSAIGMSCRTAGDASRLQHPACLADMQSLMPEGAHDWRASGGEAVEFSILAALESFRGEAWAVAEWSCHCETRGAYRAGAPSSRHRRATRKYWGIHILTSPHARRPLPPRRTSVCLSVSLPFCITSSVVLSAQPHSFVRIFCTPRPRRSVCCVLLTSLELGFALLQTTTVTFFPGYT